MKVLFVYTNINGSHTDCYAPGLASIISMIRLNNHNASMVFVKTEEDYNKVLAEVERFRPHVVGLSSVSSQFNFVCEITNRIKENHPEIITVCGGTHPTIYPGCVLEARSLDDVFVGESENAFVEFLEKLSHGRDYKDTDNLAYAKEGRLVVNRLKPLITDLDSLPIPDKDVYPYEDNIKKEGLAHFLFSRGCPYLCTYCSNHAIAKVYNMLTNIPRYRSPEKSIVEIEEAVSKFKIDTVSIMDDIFGLNVEWREEFCEKYKQRIKIKFYCLLRANVIDEEFLRLLKDAGCYHVQIGIESGNPYLRNTILNRNMSNEQIVKAFELVKKYKMTANAINMIGLPGETEEMLWDTIRLNRRVKPTLSSVNIFYPYKGTKLGDYCFKEGIVSEYRYPNFSNERRESVLNFSHEHKEKLIRYKNNWEMMVYPYTPRAFKHCIRRTSAWKHLGRLKRWAKGGAR